MNRVGIIGAGIFGLESAKQLAQHGFNVTLFEQNEQILNEATANSVLRLHLGLHYPRDHETAMQSIVGYGKFLEHYRDFVNLGFENYYGIAKSQSKVDKHQFKVFADKVGIPITEVTTSSLENFGFDSKKISAAWKCDEGVIDISKLRIHFEEILKNHVKIYTSCEIQKAHLNGKKWHLEDSSGVTHEFDFVIQATYGTDRIATPPEINPKRIYEYHKTLTLEIKCEVSNFGLTVIDGDFITVLPKGFGDTLLIYGPHPSVLERSVGFEFPTSWEDKITFDFKRSTENIVDRFQEWFPQIKEIEVVSLLTTVRSIQPNMQATDKRITTVKEPAENFLTIWSGKIDHCVEIAEIILSRISQRVS
jgi:glycine/D-amino acid oxidase-like deaminating enzyme